MAIERKSYIRGYTDALKDVDRIASGEHPDFPEVDPGPGGDVPEWELHVAMLELRKRVKKKKFK